MTNLRDKMKQDMVLIGLTERTQKTYLDAIVRLYEHYHQSPAKLSNEEIRNYLLHLKKKDWHPTPIMLLFSR